MSNVLQDTLITPHWPAPDNVKAVQTTRAGGISSATYQSLNLGTHVNDDPLVVAKNRQLLNTIVPTEPVWLNQVHGTRVIDAANSRCIEDADASFSTQKNTVCVTMSADCLPILICDKAGTTVSAIHASWKTICYGIIEETIKALPVEASELMVWFGPAIGPSAFEVGSEVRALFLEKYPESENAFKATEGSKWLGDLYKLAQQRLHALAVDDIYGEVVCTYSDPERFFSYRRDGDTGRMATMIWLSD